MMRGQKQKTRSILFLVGNRIEEKDIPQWRYWILNPVDFKASGSRLV